MDNEIKSTIETGLVIIAFHTHPSTVELFKKLDSAEDGFTKELYEECIYGAAYEILRPSIREGAITKMTFIAHASIFLIDKRMSLAQFLSEVQDNRKHYHNFLQKKGFNI